MLLVSQDRFAAGRESRAILRKPLHLDVRSSSSPKPNQRRVTGDITGRNTMNKNVMLSEWTFWRQARSVGRRTRDKERQQYQEFSSQMTGL